MSKSGDDKPLAPRRSLSKSPGRSESSPQPVMTPPYAGSPQPYAVVAEPETGQTFPVPPTPTTSQPTRKPPQTAAQQRRAGRTRTVRRARLRLVRVDPWSVTKTALLLSIAFGIMCIVAVFLVFSIMSASGLWTHINQTIQGVLNQQPGQAFDITKYVGIDRVMGITLLIATVDVVLITALSTLGAFIYNMSASLLGGVEVTLAEDLK